MHQTAAAMQNWAALLRLELRCAADRTRLVPLRRYGPLSVQRPFYPEADCCHVYLLHPPGGVVGGDSLDLEIDLKPDAQGLFTAPGAAKFYLSAGPVARVRQHFAVGAGAGLEFLPQENIYFPGAEVDARTTLEVDAGGRVLLWEKHCFGRPANRESFDRGRLQSRIDLRLDGTLVHSEIQRVDADEIARASGLRGQPVCGTLLAAGIDFCDETVAGLQKIKPDPGWGGVSRPRPDLLTARYIGPDTAELDRYFVKLWERLRAPLMRRAACRPRIWNT